MTEQATQPVYENMIVNSVDFQETIQLVQDYLQVSIDTKGKNPAYTKDFNKLINEVQMAYDEDAEYIVIDGKLADDVHHVISNGL